MLAIKILLSMIFILHLQPLNKSDSLLHHRGMCPVCYMSDVELSLGKVRIFSFFPYISKTFHFLISLLLGEVWGERTLMGVRFIDLSYIRRSVLYTIKFYIKHKVCSMELPIPSCCCSTSKLLI